MLNDVLEIIRGLKNTDYAQEKKEISEKLESILSLKNLIYDTLGKDLGEDIFKRGLFIVSKHFNSETGFMVKFIFSDTKDKYQIILTNNKEEKLSISIGNKASGATIVIEHNIDSVEFLVILAQLK